MSPAEQARHRFLVLVTVACALLIPWIAVLAFTLPPHYVVKHWIITWVGLDTVLLGCLAATAYLAYRRRQLVIVMSLVTGALLLSDAWFDVMTASTRADLLFSVGSAVLLEIPLAVLLIRAGVRLVRLAVAQAEDVQVPLWQAPLLTTASRH
jgi:hypothetical protein